MSNTSRLFRYGIRDSSSNAVSNFYVRADTESLTLGAGAIQNLEGAAIAATRTFNIVIASKGGPKSKVSFARSVTVRMLASVGGLSVGSLVTVPVFRSDRWVGYSPGLVTVYRGVSCVVVSTMDGSPVVGGRRIS